MKGFPLLIIISIFIISSSFEIKDKVINPVRILQDEDETDLNYTAFEPPEESQIEKHVLLGFEAKPKSSGNKDVLKEMNIFFKNIPGITKFKKYVYFTVNYTPNKRNRRRRLDEKGTTQKALKGILEETTLDEDIVKYIVDIEFDDMKSFNLGKNIQFLDTNYNDLDFIQKKLEDLQESDTDVQIPPYISLNSSEQIKKEKILYFKADEIKELQKKQIKIIGKFSKDYEPDEKLQLKFICINCFPSYSEIDAFFEKYDNDDSYSLTCYFSDIFKINLEDAYDNKTLRNLSENSDYEILSLKSNKNENLLNIDYNYMSTISNLKYKKKSNGLSTGAITGIVIGCVAVLICVTVLAIYFGRKKKAIAHSSAIEFYNSSFALNNDK